MHLIRTLVIFSLLTLSLFSQNFEFAGETLFIRNGSKLYRQMGATLQFDQIDPGNGPENINTLLFVSQSEGYLASGTKLFRTTDSGVTWQQVLNGTVIGHSGKIAAMGEMLLVLTPDHKILRSFNSGASFDTVTLSLPVSLDLLSGFMGASSPRYVVLYAPDFNPFGGQMNYLLSTDSCKTWSLINTFGEKGRSRFISERHGFIITPPRVFTTSNGGASWNTAFEPGQVLMPGGGYWADSLTGYQATYNEHKIYRTLDGGLNWSVVYTGTADVDYLVAGGNCVTFHAENGHDFYYSSDKGNTWSVLDTATSVREQTEVEPVGFVLKGNYPNPFNGSTVISFSSKIASSIDLYIHDATGTLVDIKKGIVCKPGLNEVNWNSGNLPSGTYIFRVVINGGRDQHLTGKMVLLK